jgi:hypothetical protein
VRTQRGVPAHRPQAPVRQHAVEPHARLLGLGDRIAEQGVVIGIALVRDIGDHEPPSGVGDASLVAELGRPTPVALPNWARVGVDQRAAPIGDRALAGEAQVFLGEHLLGHLELALQLGGHSPGRWATRALRPDGDATGLAPDLPGARTISAVMAVDRRKHSALCGELAQPAPGRAAPVAQTGLGGRAGGLHVKRGALGKLREQVGKGARDREQSLVGGDSHDRLAIHSVATSASVRVRRAFSPRSDQEIVRDAVNSDRSRSSSTTIEAPLRSAVAESTADFDCCVMSPFLTPGRQRGGTTPR